jgi:hypothetical protein
MANLCVAQLLYLDSVNPNQDITLYINVSTLAPRLQFIFKIGFFFILY